MGTHLIDLRQDARPLSNDLGGLSAYLTPLIGEPFRFARVTYGDELTLHFGDLRHGRSPKLRQMPYGAYILGLRCSPWLLKFGLEPVILTDVVDLNLSLPSHARPLGKGELEAGTFIEAESRVLVATPFVVKTPQGFGLQLRMTDGSSLLVFPAPQEPDGPEDEGLPALADWELTSPRGLLNAGPGVQWTFNVQRQPESERVISPTTLQDDVAVKQRGRPGRGIEFD